MSILMRFAPYLAVAALIVGLAGWGWTATNRADRLADELAISRLALKTEQDNATRAQISRDVWQAHAERERARASETSEILEDIRNDPDAKNRASDAILRTIDRLGLRKTHGDRKNGASDD